MKTRRMVRGGRWRALWLGLALLALSGPARAADTDAATILNLAPANAYGVLLIPSLIQLSQKLAMINDTLGINSRPLADALSEFKSDIGATRGVRDDGPLMIVAMGVPNLAAKGAPPPMLVFMPITDYAAFVGDFAGDASAPIATLKTPRGRVAYARRFENMALVSADRALVEGYKPPTSPSGWDTAAGKLTSSYIRPSSRRAGDAVLILNIQAMAPQLGPLLNHAAAMARAQDAGAAGTNGGLPPLPTPAITTASSFASALVRDTSTMMFEIDLNDDGMGITAGAQFKPGSALAAMFSNGEPAAPLLEHMTQEPYLLATALNLRGLDLAKIADGLGSGSLGSFFKQLLPVLNASKGLATVYYTPLQVGGLGASVLLGVTTAETENEKAYIDAFRSSVVTANAGQYSPNKLQIGNTPVDEYEVQFNVPQQVMQPMGALAPAMLVLGSGLMGYVAPAGGFVVVTMTPDAKLIEDSMAATQQNNGLGMDAQIVKVRERLTPGAFAEAYLSIPGVVRTVNAFLTMVNPKATVVQVPPELPPIGASASLRDSGVVTRLYLPMPDLKFLKDKLAPAQEPTGTPMVQVQPVQPQPTANQPRGEEPPPPLPGAGGAMRSGGGRRFHPGGGGGAGGPRNPNN